MKFVLSVLFSLAIISCRSSGIAGDNMAVTETASNSDYSLTISTPKIDRYVSSSGTASNITDTSDSSYFYYYFYTNSTATITTTYTIAPKSNFIATFRVKMKLVKDSTFNDTEKLEIIIYKTDGSKVNDYDSGKQTSIDIDRTVDIYDYVSKIEIIATHYGCSPKVWNYGFYIKRLTPSNLYGRTANGTIRFLDDDTTGSKLKYKDKSNKTHSIFLVNESHLFFNVNKIGFCIFCFVYLYSDAKI